MSWKSRSLTAALLSLLLGSVGCGQDEPTAATKGDANQPAQSEQAKPDEPAATTEAAPAASETGNAGSETGQGSEDEDSDTGEAAPPLPDEFEALGVAICDQYVADYVACIGDKVPEGEREAQRRIVFDNLRSWQQIKKGSDAAEQGLQTGCKIAREQAKRATQDWGCAW